MVHVEIEIKINNEENLNYIQSLTNKKESKIFTLFIIQTPATTANY